MSATPSTCPKCGASKKSLMLDGRVVEPKGYFVVVCLTCGGEFYVENEIWNLSFLEYWRAVCKSMRSVNARSVDFMLTLGDGGVLVRDPESHDARDEQK